MKLSRRRYSIQVCLCTVFLLSGALTRVCSQTSSPALLELKTCGRELKVFDDGTVVESWDGKKKERRLSKSQMHRLRQVNASSPCDKQWQLSAQAQKNPPPGRQREGPTISNIGDCFPSILGDARELREVYITRPLANYARTIVAYIPCGRVEPYRQRFISRNWQRFLSDVVEALGDQSIMEGCHCGPSDNLLDKNQPSVYITFERLEEQSVLLRIHNNSQWPIRVEAGCISAQTNTGPCRDRGIPEITNGRRVIMKYHVRADTGLYEFLGNTLSRLPSGSSALFLVARSNLANTDIYVPFIYEDEWDNRKAILADPDHAVGDPHLEHYVYFESDDLAQALMKKK